MKKTELLFFILLWGLMTSIPLPAQVVQKDMAATIFVIKEWQDEYALNEIVGIQQDDGLEVTIENVAQELKNVDFQPLNQLKFALNPHQHYWGEIVLQNNLPDAVNYTEWVLQFSHTLTEIDLFTQQPNGTFQKYLSGEYRPYRLKAFTPTLDFNLFRVTLPVNQPIKLYFKAKADRNRISPNFEVSLRHTTAFATFLQKRKLNHYFFIGFIGMMLLYNLIGASIKQDRSFIYYSIYLIALAIYASNVTGDMEDWFGYYLFPNQPKYAYLFNLVIILGFMSYLGFVRNFLNLHQLMPNWDQFFKYLFWLGAPLTVLHTIVAIQSNYSYGVADYIPTSYVLLFLPTNIIFIYQLYKTKDKKGRFIVVGMVFWLLGIFFNFLLWAEVIGYTLIDLKTGFILEILIFSLGLAYREQETVIEKEQAHFELEKNKFLQEQEQVEIDRLTKLNELKSRLYTNITHEFRTPLTVIMGMNDNIQGFEKERNLIRRNSKNLLKLINQLLDLSKAESANLEVHKTKGNIVAYLQYLTDSFYSMATDKGVRLMFYSEEDALEIEYDETKMQHIFYNLLSNAIKFTEEGGNVILHLQQTMVDGTSFLKIKVKDTGIGIPADRLPYIFDRFYQVDDSSTRKGKGTGIGLALVQELVQLMDGKIEVRSKENQGTEFMIWMPIEITAFTEESTKKMLLTENELVDEEHFALGNHNASSDSSEGLDKSLLPPAKARGLQISGTANQNDHLPILLIIEDNRDVAEYIVSILEKTYQIYFAKNGQLGVEKAIEIVPDIIISDVMMPIKDGYEVCETLKQDERTSHIPIILLTAKAAQSDKIEGLKYGADAYLTKPFDKEELQIRLEKLIAIRQQLQERFSKMSDTSEVPDTLATSENAFLQKINNLVKNQLYNPNFGVPDLGKDLQMSDMQVYRKLKALTGKTPSSFIRSIRLQKGKTLLNTTDLTISEIAYQIGFSDPNYFSRTFHDEFGQPPSEFR